MKATNKRLLSMLLTLSMVFTMLPAALAEGSDQESGQTDPTQTCTCEIKCTDGNVNAECPICAADIAGCTAEAPDADLTEGPDAVEQPGGEGTTLDGDTQNPPPSNDLPAEEPRDDEPTEDPDAGVAPTANEDAVAQIGDQTYETLEAAIAGVTDDQTIELVADVTINQAITIGAESAPKTFTLDLNDKTISAGAAIFVKFGSNVTIQDSKSNGEIVFSSGKLEIHGDSTYSNGAEPSASQAIRSTVTLKSGTLTNTASNSDAIVGMFGNGATFNMEGGSVINIYKKSNVDGAFAIAGNGSRIAGKDYGGIVLNISGGKVESAQDCAIYLPGYNDTEISGGIIEGWSGIEIDSGNLTISDEAVIRSTYEGDGTRKYKDTGDGNYNFGAALAIVSKGSQAATGYYGHMNIKIAGGTIESASYYAIDEYDLGYVQSKDKESIAYIDSFEITGGEISGEVGSVLSDNKTKFISGGTFSSDPSAYVDTENYSVTEADGKYTVQELTDVAEVNGTKYKTLAKAIENTNNATVTLLANVTENVVIPAGKTVTIDLNGNTITNVNKDTIENNGTLTINGEGTVDNVSHAMAALFNNGTATLNGGAFTRSKENGQNTTTSGGNSYYNIVNHGTLTINDSVTVNQDGHYSSLIENGYYSYNGKDSQPKDPRSNYISGGVTSAKPEMNITGGSFSGGLNTVKNDDGGILNISGGTFENVSQAAFLNWHKATVTGGVFSIQGKAQAVVLNGGGNNDINAGELKVTGGYFSSEKPNFAAMNGTAAYLNGIEVSGGYFTSDPAKYLVDGKVSTVSDKAGYAFMVADKTDEIIPVKPVVDKPAVPKADELPNTIPADEKEEVATAAGTITAPEVADIANETAQNITDDEAAALKQAAVAQGLTVNDGDTATLYVTTFMEVEPKVYNPTTNELVLEITPKYNLVVSTAATADDIKEDNSQVIGDAQELKVDQPVKISMELPSSFTVDAGTKIYVQHEKNDVTYVYEATVTEVNGKKMISFVNPHGFSTFTVTTAAPAAQIGSTSYATLQNAVDAVADGETIKALADGSATVSESKTFMIDTNKDGGGNYDISITVGSKYKLRERTENGVTTYTVTRKSSSSSSSGSSSSSSKTYSVSKASSIKNGSITVSPKNAEEGDTVTITVKPDSGYALDELTVTDQDGDPVKRLTRATASTPSRCPIPGGN